jgi:hypothetical protein
MSRVQLSPRPLSAQEKLMLLTKFQRMILRASARRRDFELRYNGAIYTATLTGFGRCIVRDAYGHSVAASGFGWLSGDEK